jgi:hypothetical protein
VLLRCCVVCFATHIPSSKATLAVLLNKPCARITARNSSDSPQGRTTTHTTLLRSTTGMGKRQRQQWSAACKKIKEALTKQGARRIVWCMSDIPAVVQGTVNIIAPSTLAAYSRTSSHPPTSSMRAKLAMSSPQLSPTASLLQSWLGGDSSAPSTPQRHRPRPPSSESSIQNAIDVVKRRQLNSLNLKEGPAETDQTRATRQKSVSNPGSPTLSPSMTLRPNSLAPPLARRRSNSGSSIDAILFELQQREAQQSSPDARPSKITSSASLTVHDLARLSGTSLILYLYLLREQVVLCIYKRLEYKSLSESSFTACYIMCLWQE